MSTNEIESQRRQQNLEATHGAGCEYEGDRTVQETADLRLAVENIAVIISWAESQIVYDKVGLPYDRHNFSVFRLLEALRNISVCLHEAIKQKAS